MQFIEYFYTKILKYDLLNKFKYNKTTNLPKIKKIILNFNCKTSELRKISTSLLALELITQQNPKITTIKHPNLLLKLKKGNPIGCKVTIRKKQMFTFLEKLIVEILPSTKTFNPIKISSNLKPNSCSFNYYETSNFAELRNHYFLFNNLPNLNITIILNSKTKEELIFTLKSLQLPIKNS